MKRVRLFRTRTAIGRLIDASKLFYAVALRDQGQQTVVWRKENMAGPRSQRDREALGANARIDDGDKDRVFWPEAFGLIEPIGASENAAGIFVTEVGNQNVRETL